MAHPHRRSQTIILLCLLQGGRAWNNQFSEPPGWASFMLHLGRYSCSQWFVNMNSKHVNNETRRFPDKIWVTFTVRVDMGHVVSRQIPSCLKTSHTLRTLVLTAQPKCQERSPHFSLVGETLPSPKKRKGGFLQPLAWLSYRWLGTLLELPGEVLSSVSRTGQMRKL